MKNSQKQKKNLQKAILLANKLVKGENMNDSNNKCSIDKIKRAKSIQYNNYVSSINIYNYLFILIYINFPFFYPGGLLRYNKQDTSGKPKQKNND
jgi:hypothetical protein